MIRAIGVAVAGACMAAAAPAMAMSAEAAATPSKSEFYRPLILDRSAASTNQSNQALILARPASPNAFGTVALNAGVTFYDARFRRVAAADAKDPMVLRLAAGAANLDPIGKLRMVQQEISEAVHWQHDLDNMGVADFWANAGETLRRGTGDAEDIAIAKMQVLKAAGFDPKDLYISIGRHSTRGAHILLLARTANGFFSLDDREGLQPAAQNSRFTPMMTIGQGMSWIHGRRVGGNPRLASASSAKANAK
ncbi:transglutaminase-like cysteine peptidase [Sphingomonas sp. RB56-2]|uniref:Transglutaminase-like cysteine peptidase n=1 Tax=Sphingomonas brevis TaxID=2908206 RepID=A0ABT0SAS1_9SPHN|nr:transglutaminase-like cysteine peptidase [Sphingomonas brevis]MCL6741496.1 transglutaminase-like cysteine peptidase [Sphingomonas brevis]